MAVARNDYSRLKAILANSKLQTTNNAAYQVILQLIGGVEKFEDAIIAQVAEIININNSITNIAGATILRGIRADQPLATEVNENTLYYVTDEFTTEQSINGNWVTYADTAGSGGITELTGDVTAGPGSGSEVATIAANAVVTSKILNDNVTYAKIQNVSASPRVLARFTAGAGDIEEATLGTGLSFVAGALTAAGGGNVTDTGAFGSEPGSPVDGDLYFPDNGFFTERFNGTIWQGFGPSYPLIAPIDGDYAWINQGGASVVTSKGGIFLRAPAVGTLNARIRKKAAPATPYTMTAMVLPFLFSGTQGCGICFRQSSDGKLHVFQIDIATTAIFWRSAKLTSATVFSANYSSDNFPAGPRGPLWLKIGDDGTNRTWALSADGENFIQLGQIGNTDFLVADEVGFFANTQNTNADAGIGMLSIEFA